MPEILAPTDPESVVVADIKAQYAARSIVAGVGTKLRDGVFTKVRLMGGSASFVSSGAMVTFECWAPTEGAAWDLAAVTVALVDSMPERVGICSGVTNVGEPVNQPDPDAGTPRYVFTKVLHLRKHAM